MEPMQKCPEDQNSTLLLCLCVCVCVCVCVCLIKAIKKRKKVRGKSAKLLCQINLVKIQKQLGEHGKKS